MSDYYDRQGKPIDFKEWARLHSNLDYKRVARTHLTHKTLVSTVWLGLDHGFTGGPPVIFETMVFYGKNDDEPMWRYHTEEEALAGHQKVVDDLKSQGYKVKNE